MIVVFRPRRYIVEKNSKRIFVPCRVQVCKEQTRKGNDEEQNDIRHNFTQKSTKTHCEETGEKNDSKVPNLGHQDWLSAYGDFPFGSCSCRRSILGSKYCNNTMALRKCKEDMCAVVLTKSRHALNMLGAIKLKC